MADRPASAGPRSAGTAANLLAVALIGALIAAIVLWQRSATDEGAGSHSEAIAPIPDNARVLLDDQLAAMSSARSATSFAAAAGPGRAARRFATDAWQARRRLGITGVRLEYQRGGTVADRADGSTRALVRVRWATSARSPWGASATRSVPVWFRAMPHGRRFGIIGIDGGSRPVPPWLVGRVKVGTAGSATVLTIDSHSGGQSARLDVRPLAKAAVRKVSGLVPDSRQRLCVIVPDDVRGTATLLGDPATKLRHLAAVTTSITGSVDGSVDGATVVINPAEWATMDKTSQQVVMTHEATHAMTGVVKGRIDLLVAEGFADYVALYGDRRPVAVTAGQILRQVKVSGAPRHLPASRDFNESSNGFGAIYEASWMLFRMLDRDFGSDAVVGFYDDVLKGASTAAAMRQSFGLPQGEVTTRWRAYLTKSASTLS